MFSQRLKELREEKMITQAKLAEEIGVTPQNISYFEKGREPSYDILIKLADYFGVTTDYLIGRSPYKTTEEEFVIKNLEEKYNLNQFDDCIYVNNESKVILNKIITSKIEPLYKNLIMFVRKHLFFKDMDNTNEKLELNNIFEMLIGDLSSLFEKIIELSKNDYYFYALYPNLIKLHLNNSPIPFELEQKVNKITAMEEIPKINHYFIEEIRPLLDIIYADLLEMFSFYNVNVSSNANDLFSFISDYFTKMSDKDKNFADKVIKNIMDKKFSNTTSTNEIEVDNNIPF
ncbi:HTH-type transcriptional regulator Xre [Caloramator mitchellensis]|uniref:HTH-type transcriptional regulator Xre n=2 Tax=Caloramator mitchellensis TaxID=908809 RepID=A0A0R3JXL2_CALMK|nr:HTH-type transcriptional regulator Xre [Caloramator mitchellensis]